MKTITGILFLVAYSVAVVALLMALGVAKENSFADTTVYIQSGNVFKGTFTEPFESVMVVLESGDFFVFTTREEFSIGIGAGYIQDFLKLQGKSVAQGTLVIHNHFHHAHFTQADIRQYHKLRRMGFKGIFAIYHTPTGKVIKYEDGEEIEIGQDKDVRKYFEDRSE